PMPDQFPPLFTALSETEDAELLLKNAAARTLVLQTAGEIRSDWAHASDVLNRALRTHKGLASRARRLVSESVYALVRFDRRLDAMIDEVLRTHRGPGRALSPPARDRVKL